MKQIAKQLKLSKNEYYETHLSIINCILPEKMTPTEIKVLSRFMGLSGDIASDRFGATAKKFVKENLNLTSAGLSNYLRSLKEKRFLIEGDSLSILPILFPEPNDQIYLFKLTNLG